MENCKLLICCGKVCSRVKAGNNMGERPEWILGHKSHANTFESDVNRDFVEFLKEKSVNLSNLQISLTTV